MSCGTLSPHTCTPIVHVYLGTVYKLPSLLEGISWLDETVSLTRSIFRSWQAAACQSALTLRSDWLCTVSRDLAPRSHVTVLVVLRYPVMFGFRFPAWGELTLVLEILVYVRVIT